MRIALTLFLVLAPGLAAAAPEDPGPLNTLIYEPGTVLADNVEIPVQVHHPDGPGPFPVVTLMHGNLRTGRYHAVLAQTLASRGFVVLLPDMPCGLSGCDHEANARQLQALLAWAVTESAGSGALAGKIDGTKQGMIGHSYGGLGTFLSARPNTVQAIVLFDPKDDLGAAANDATMVDVPSAHLMATNRGACNDDWGTAVYPQTGAPHLRIRVVGSGHCDPEDPSDSLCPLACGRGDRSTTPIFRRYAIAFLGCVLQADPSYAPYIGGAELDADQTANRLDQVDQAELLTLPCQGAAPPFDAGISVDTGVVPSDDTGTGPADQGLLGDTGASPDAGIRPDAASPSPSPTDDAEGCTSLGGAALPTTLLLLGLSAFRRRRTPPQ
ncbi:MAG: hypothetical protein IPG45_07430 [Deltaproteobacteria bacterium]|jgi:dienelactone hydrolase|nr:hypothetical protein [Deltaproteobacteria bacterium]